MYHHVECMIKEQDGRVYVSQSKPLDNVGNIGGAPWGSLALIY